MTLVERLRDFADGWDGKRAAPNGRLQTALREAAARIEELDRELVACRGDQHACAKDAEIEELRARVLPVLGEQGWDVAVAFVSAHLRRKARIATLEEALRGLQNGTAHPSDPQLKGDQPCWCDSRGMFAQGPHDDKCLAVLAALSNSKSKGSE